MTTDAARGRTAGEATDTANPENESVDGEFTDQSIRLAISRVDPWSVMKMAFLLSVALGIALIVAVSVLWSVVNSLGVFTSIDQIVKDFATDGTPLTFLEYFQFGKTLAVTTVVAVLNIVLITAFSTVAAFLYNLVAALVGGLHVTFSDD